MVAPIAAQATLPGPNGRIWWSDGYYFWTFAPGTQTPAMRTNIEPRGMFGGLSFSGDGSRVAYQTPFYKASPMGTITYSHISVLPMAGGIPQDLTPGAEHYDAAPAFCGDGTIVFSRHSTESSASGLCSTSRRARTPW